MGPAFRVQSGATRCPPRRFSCWKRLSRSSLQQSRRDVQPAGRFGNNRCCLPRGPPPDPPPRAGEGAAAHKPEPDDRIRRHRQCHADLQERCGRRSRLAGHDARRRPRRVRRCRWTFRMRQVVVDEARHRPGAAGLRRDRHLRRQGARTGKDRRHGVPECESAALAQGDRQRAAPARNRGSRIGNGSASTRKSIARRPKPCSGRSGSTASAIAFRGSCPAACSNGCRSAAR